MRCALTSSTNPFSCCKDNHNDLRSCSSTLDCSAQRRLRVSALQHQKRPPARPVLDLSEPADHGFARRALVQRRHGRWANSSRLAYEAGVFDHSMRGVHLFLLLSSTYRRSSWLTPMTTVDLPELGSNSRASIPFSPRQPRVYAQNAKVALFSV